MRLNLENVEGLKLKHRSDDRLYIKELVFFLYNLGSGASRELISFFVKRKIGTGTILLA